MKAPVLVVLALAGCAGNTTFVTPERETCDGGAAAPDRLRIATYNIRAGLETSLDEIERVIAEIDPHVVALQEVDRNASRTGSVDQAAKLAERLGYKAVFAAAIDRGGGEYGIALLSRLPIASAERIEIDAVGSYEPRVAIDATICVGASPVRVLATHSDFLPWSAGGAARILATRARSSLGQGTIVIGDLNLTPKDPALRPLSRLGLTDVVGERAEGTTYWPSPRRLDYIFVDGKFARRVAGAAIGDSRASDHHPVHVDFDLSAGGLAAAE